ncbi:MAG: Crp/Fnr family transcriptional regulator [Cyclobacteriaceae bacterium]|jgi:cAMP-binding proteins - catabolite gene activator and regulatory subunit of cAMP-dependent protein kinases|uniref:Crp/Fnr family transcriptional regulator n=1 Tax=Algoriphagus marincola TaxID=264027 RepID=A0ABS7N4W0_9BACT|nr:Crp/Fnr family transcriptional regulator [Algoriphagus marincola]MBY5951371.1 Crp/Fnr family transcriptional regulator [Algoriphagus marincola]MCR9084617.1 Crp/Fnr family transcriptional regulator [Cyclobacteriaceae bacterium]
MNEFSPLHSYIEKLHPLDEETKSQLEQCFIFQKVKKNEFLLQEGEVCKYNYFVIKGSLRLYKVDPKGEELIRYFAFENKFATNLTSFITGMPSEEFIQANEKTELLAIPKSIFLDLVESLPPINRVYRNMLENAYITSQKRIYNFQSYSALERLKWLLEQYPRILSRLPSKLIASYLGITPFTLSRLKAEL